MKQKESTLAIWLGMGVLYLVWGGTYLGIRFLVESVPSIFASGIRNVCAAVLMGGWAISTGKWQKVDRQTLWINILAGFLMLTMGNGLVTVAGKWMPSGFSSLFLSISPIILVVLVWLIDGERPTKQTVWGTLLGVIGVGILISQKKLTIPGEESHFVWGIVCLFCSVLAWDIGVLIVKKSKTLALHTSQIAAMQMFFGGIISLFIAGLRGEWQQVALDHISQKSWMAFGYLVVMGSIVGFSVFSWLSKKAPPTQIATYTYVNPLVAILLGSFFADEKLTIGMLLAAVGIIGAVFLITSRRN